LGTTVAYDALLAIGQHTLARRRREWRDLIGKLDQFVTLASPVDTIHSMFESHVAKYHRYSRVFEGLRGDIGSVPFADRRRPHMHWINIWDRADIISGPLFSPNQKRASAMPVDNLEVRSLRFPNPSASHIAYFAHGDVMRLLFEIIFEEASSDRSGSPSERRWRTPVPRRRSTRWQLVMLVIPWTVAAYGLAWLVAPGALATRLLAGSTLALVGATASGYVFGRAQGHMKPIATMDASQWPPDSHGLGAQPTAASPHSPLDAEPYERQDRPDGLSPET
jgi:hypothetical protein